MPFPVERVKAVGEAAALANVKLVGPIVIDVPYSDAIASIDIDSGAGIKSRSPVRNPSRQLLPERRHPCEGVCSDIAEVRFGCRGDVLLDRRKLNQAATIPGLIPPANAIEEFAILLARYFVTNDPAGQRIELSPADGAQRFNPLTPTSCDRTISGIEDGFFEIGRERLVSARKGR